MNVKNTVDVLLAGKLLPNADADSAAAAFAKMANITPEQARVLITCGKPKLVKSGLAPETAQNLARHFAALGIGTVTRPVVAPAPPPPPKAAPPTRATSGNARDDVLRDLFGDDEPPTAKKTRTAGGVVCPKCGHRQTGGTECERCGIIFRKQEERAARAAAPQQPPVQEPPPTAPQAPPTRAQGGSFCTNCGKPVAVQAFACPGCGLPPRLERKFCPNCGAAVDARQAMCVKCGIALAAAGPTAAPVARTRGKKMNSNEAIKTCFRKYSDFSGRASRAEFWYFYILQILANFAFGTVLGAVGASVLTAILLGLGLLIGLVFFLPSLAVGARRLHDTGKSGWLQLLYLIPFVGFIPVLIMCALPGDEGPNQYGPPPGSEPVSGDPYGSAYAQPPAQVHSGGVQAQVGRMASQVVDGGKSISSRLPPQFVEGVKNLPNQLPPQLTEGVKKRRGVLLPLLIGGGALMALAILLLAIVWFPGYKMRALNSSAESDLRNAYINEEVLMGDWQIYGVSCRGVLNAPRELGTLTGPMNGATTTSDGAMLCGLRRDNGKPGCVPIGVSNDVSLYAVSSPDAYVIFAKHKGGNRVYATDSDSTSSIYFCENKEWAGVNGLPAVFGEHSAGVDDLRGEACGGSPIPTWQAL